MNTLNILGSEHQIIDTKEKMTVPDCFVASSNTTGTGHGEAKFYVGNENETTKNFFGDRGFKIKCFLLKEDLLLYLDDCKAEYFNPEQQYRNKDIMKDLWQDRLDKVMSLEDILYFELEDQSQIHGPRVYVNSEDPLYTLIRELSLPNITYLSAMKLQAKEGFIYYFKLFVDYFNEVEHPHLIQEAENAILDNNNLGDDQKEQIRKARVGHGKYRENLLKECSFCPITSISDDRLLIASHIKPWIKSETPEKTDPKNGFMFTPTYDFLFDRGFISFDNDKKIIISPWLSNMTCSKLNISPNKKYVALPVEGREAYLEYHRENIFKK